MSEKARIQEEICKLRKEVQVINLRLDQLCQQLDRLEDFELVDSRSQVSITPVAENCLAAKDLSRPAVLPSSSAAGHCVPSEIEREEAAIQTGRFFLRCIKGEPRGESGRSRIRLQNNIYIIIRDIHGSLYTEPVRVARSYREAKRYVSDSRGSFGDSVFAGFHAEWEAKTAVQAAGFGWPLDNDW